MADVLNWTALLSGQQTLSTGEYMRLSSAMSQRTQRDDAEDLRQWAAASILRHVALVSRQLQQPLLRAQIISAYVAEWQRFALGSQVLGSIMGRAMGPQLRETMTQAWRSHVFRRLAPSLAAAVVGLADDARSGASAADPQPLTALHAAMTELDPARALYAQWLVEPYAWAAVRHVVGAVRH
ncbi:hypothetical protein GGI21_003945, partial [Coemansia aciculifera]